jgi:hypothetical protein
MCFSFLHYFSKLFVQSDFRWLAYCSLKKIQVADQSFKCGNFLLRGLLYLLTFRWRWIRLWFCVILLPLSLLFTAILEIGVMALFELCELLFCEENYPE